MEKKKMKSNKHMQNSNEHQENLDISDEIVKIQLLNDSNYKYELTEIFNNMIGKKYH